jgi:serine acetyltransferase
VLPVVGGNVSIGAGAKILGGVTIGDHARIGANAVVLQDVPRGATAVGVPATILAGGKHYELAGDLSYRYALRRDRSASADRAARA